jgi:hypothetical protein
MTTTSITTAGAPAPPAGLACKRCGSSAIKTRWQTFRDGGRHLRAECAVCGTFRRYLAQANRPRAFDVVMRLVPHLSPDERRKVADLLDQLQEGGGR